MVWDRERERIEQSSEAKQLTTALLAVAESSESLAEFDAAAIAAITQLPSIVSAALFLGRGGHWSRLDPAQTTTFTGADDLLGECLDQDRPVSNSEGLAAAPVQIESASAVLLLAQGDFPESDLLRVADSLAGLIGAARSQVAERISAERRVDRLATILQITEHWHQSEDVASLLEQMAEAATDLLDAERASIFLWDKPNRILVGRPALGVENGELRVADDQGIVGDVVQSGELRRVDLNPLDQAEIDRTVDQQLDFETRTLLCAPLRGAEGELFGAFELINKRTGNFSVDDEAAIVELAGHAAVALESTQQREHLVQSRAQVAAEAAQGVQLIGNCEAIKTLRAKIERVAATELAVLILGENGCGKEVVSQMIHYLSPRRSEPFVAVNCAAIAETLLESELFGHEAGAFTDARETRVGKFELAAEGTLFLDEIGDMSAGGQAKLLRVLEEKTVIRVGGATPIATNARVIAATNQDLAELVQERRFREDLFFRLNVVTLELPPLRDRGDDILLLAEHFLGRFAAAARRRPPKLLAAARKRLLAHAWPGNVRELRNVMERLVFLSNDEQIDEEDLLLNLSPSRRAAGEGVAEDMTLNDATREFQIQYIKRRIERMRGNVAAAARELGLHRSNLYRKMRQLGMDEGEE